MPIHLALYSHLTSHEPKSTLVHLYRKEFPEVGVVGAHTCNSLELSALQRGPVSSKEEWEEVRSPYLSGSSSSRALGISEATATSVPATLQATKPLHIREPGVHGSLWLSQTPHQLAKSHCSFSSSPALLLHTIPPPLSQKYGHALTSSPSPFPSSTVHIIFILTLDLNHSLQPAFPASLLTHRLFSHHSRSDSFRAEVWVMPEADHLTRESTISPCLPAFFSCLKLCMHLSLYLENAPHTVTVESPLPRHLSPLTLPLSPIRNKHGCEGANAGLDVSP